MTTFMSINQKIIGLVTTLTLVGSLAACSSTPTPESQQAEPDPSAENTTQPDAMKEDGGAMKEDGGAMKEDGGAMKEETPTKP